MDLKDTYNKIAEDWVSDHNKDSWWQEGADKFLGLLNPKAKVLDVGCGGGIKTKYLVDKGFDVTGIDFSDKMIEIARRKYPDLDFRVFDIYDLDQLEEKFDGLFVQAVLLHVPKIKVLEVLTKMVGRLKDGGLIYLAVKGVKDDGVEESVVVEGDYGYDYERFFSFFSLDELKDYFNKLNLEVVWDSNFDGQTRWIQLIGKKL